MRTKYGKENEDKGLSGSFDMEDTVVDDLGIREEIKVNTIESDISYDEIFSDGKYEALVPEFLSISKEIEDAEYDIIFEDGEYELLPPDFHDITRELYEGYESGVCEEDGEVTGPLEEDEEIDIGFDDSSVPSEVKKTSLKKHFVNKKVIVGSVIALVALGVGYSFISDSGSSVVDLENSINKLYTTSKKEDVKENVSIEKLEKYYDKVDGLKDSEDKSEIVDELDTMSCYIADKDKLDEINSSSYDFNSSSINSDLDKIRQSVVGYSVVGLSSSMQEIIDNIQKEYDYYISVKNELGVLKGTESPDVSGYQAKIGSITHTPNRSELQSVLNSISSDIKLEETVEEIKNSTSEKVDEVVTSAKEDLGSKVSDMFEGVKSFFSDLFSSIGGIFSSSSANS